MYTITRYTRRQAARLGVHIQPSANPTKKLDVYRHGRKIATVGAIGYDDYPTFMKKYGTAYANRRRKLYKQRHSRNRKVVHSNGYYADQLLW